MPLKKPTSWRSRTTCSQLSQYIFYSKKACYLYFRKISHLNGENVLGYDLWQVKSMVKEHHFPLKTFYNRLAHLVHTVP